jgi:hypothetical protein
MSAHFESCARSGLHHVLMAVGTACSANGRISSKEITTITIRAACPPPRRPLHIRRRAAAGSRPSGHPGTRRSRRLEVHASTERHCRASVRKTALARPPDAARRSRRTAYRRGSAVAINKEARDEETRHKEALTSSNGPEGEGSFMPDVHIAMPDSTAVRVALRRPYTCEVLAALPRRTKTTVF